MCRRCPKSKPEEAQESRMTTREAASAILGDPKTRIEDLDVHLEKLRKMGFPETLVEEFRTRLCIGDSEPN